MKKKNLALNDDFIENGMFTIMSAVMVDICGALILIGTGLHYISISTDIINMGASTPFEILSRMYLGVGEGFLLVAAPWFIISGVGFVGLRIMSIMGGYLNDPS